MRFILTSIILILISISCNKKGEEDDVKPPIEDEPIEISLNIGTTFQTIHNFGASDAWSTQFVGKHWPEAKRNQIADLLFSMDMNQAESPIGIGLSSWRFNIGGGSAEQGADSQITDEWRRAECFIDTNEEYDWTRHQGQQWFLKAAKQRGVETFIGFVNSPPVVYTKNQKAWSADGFSTNLKESNYEKYADFLSKVVAGVSTQTGVTFDYISPLNEPQWEWKCCSQEGSPWNNSEISSIVKSINNSFIENQISAKIEISDAGQIDYLYGSVGNPNRSNQIKNFFDVGSANYIGDLPSVAQKIAGHSYWTTWDLDWLVSSRQALTQKIDEVNPDLDYWMTEYTILDDNEEINGNGRDLGIDPALYIARVIHADMTIANANVWQWWLAISPYNYKDGLVYIDHNKYDGNVYDSKMLWALGHYSRFIRPGMKRIETHRSDSQSIAQSLSGLMESAYVSAGGDKIVVVFVNQLTVDEKVKFIDLQDGFNSISTYQTTASENDNLRYVDTVDSQVSIIIPKRGMVTCVIGP
jgi:hypothetical protein